MKRTVVADCRFVNLRWSHLQSQVNSVCREQVVYKVPVVFSCVNGR